MGSSSMIEIGGGPGLLLRLIGTNFWEVSTSTEMMMMMMIVSTSNLILLKTNAEKILPKKSWFQCSFLQNSEFLELAKTKSPQKDYFWRLRYSIRQFFSGPMCTWGSIIGSQCLSGTILKPYLIFVTDTRTVSVEKKNCHVEKFQISVHETCGES